MKKKFLLIHILDEEQNLQDKLVSDKVQIASLTSTFV